MHLHCYLRRRTSTCTSLSAEELSIYRSTEELRIRRRIFGTQNGEVTELEAEDQCQGEAHVTSTFHL